MYLCIVNVINHLTGVATVQRASNKMIKNNFQALIQKITGRDFVIDTTDAEIVNGKEYCIYRILPATKHNVRFYWKAAKTDEKLLRSFITAFTAKYREPNPDCYNYTYGGKEYKWELKTDEEKEFAYYNHSSRMYSKDQLMKQVEANFSSPDMLPALLRYGFYPTEYGVGIFCFWLTDSAQAAITEMKKHLSKLSIPFANEFSDARWVYRFKLGIDKATHTSILSQFK